MGAPKGSENYKPDRLLASCFWAAAASEDCAARPERGGLGVAGRGELQLARASRRSAPRTLTVQKKKLRKQSCGVGARRLTACA